MSNISITRHPEHKLKYPKFLCDFPLKEDAPPPFNLLVTGFKFICFVGKPASGKTSLLVSLLRDKKVLKKTFNHVIPVIPESSRRSMKTDPFKDIPPNQIFDDLEQPEKLLDLVKNFSEQNETSLIVLDDQQSYLKMPTVARILNHIIANRRHLKVSIICLLQTWNMLPLRSRKLVNILITFKPSKKEWTSIYEEMLEASEEESKQIFDYCFKTNNDDGHKWLLIDNTSNKVFSGFDEIKIED